MKKNKATERPQTETVGKPASDLHNLGPQYAKDTPFAARMRLHQSWYRAHVLRVPCGTGPSQTSTRYYGNMLRRDDGAKGYNFISAKIFNVVKQRLEEGRGVVESFRLLNNMLSSQPMCFNLFGPMVVDQNLATELWKLILPNEIEHVVRVMIEYAPEPPDEYLVDKTAFDAFVEYRNHSGRLGFIGIETKLTEPFSQKRYDGPAYRRWMEDAGSPWRQEAWDSVAHVRYNQLWRDHLLAVAMLKHERSPYHNGRLMLVRHPDDSQCTSTVQAYRELLKEDDPTFTDMPLNKLLRIWKEYPVSGEWRDWLEEFSLRYLNLDASKRVS